MRTIKFRGRRIDNNEWVYGYLYRLQLTNGEACVILTQDNNHLDNSLKPKYHLAFTLWVDLFIVDTITVGQFTGLYDKNGKEIYEGDIVKRTDGYSYIVKYEFGSFYTRLIGGDKEDVYRLALFNNKTVIVGNIHDNPDLMKGEQQ